MSGVLEQEEVDALMDGLSSGDLDASNGSGQPVSRPYDFTTQDYSVRRLLPAVQGLQERFAETLLASLQEWVPGVHSATPGQSDILNLDDAEALLGAHCAIAELQSFSLPGDALLILEERMVYEMVDLHYGGRGGRGRAENSENLSSTEIRFFSDFIQALLPKLSECWPELCREAPQLGNCFADTRCFRDMRAKESLIATRFELQIGECSGGFWTALPWSAIESLQEKPACGVIANDAGREVWERDIQRAVADLPLETIAVLAEMELSLKRISSFKVGDIIPIDSPDAVTVKVDGIPVLEGGFGTHDGQLAVRVNGRL